MAEEIIHGPVSHSEADQQHDDVLGKIDQLLNRHRTKTSNAGVIPVLTDAPREEAVPIEDGIPILSDVVSGPGRPAEPALSPGLPSTISSVLILRRMAIAIEAEHARLREQLSGDATQARMLDRLVAELRRALPAAVRDAITVKTAESSRPDDNGRL